MSTDRRGVRVALTPAGRELVARVSDRRRKQVTRIVGRMPSADRGRVLRALRTFATAAGEVPATDWSLGWQLTDRRLSPAETLQAARA